MYQDISFENNSIVNDTVDILSKLHRDDVDLISLDSNVSESKAQIEQEVEIDNNEDDSDQDDDSMIEYISDDVFNEGNTSIDDEEVDSTCDGDNIYL